MAAITFKVWSNKDGSCGYSQSRERFQGGFHELEFLAAYVRPEEAEQAVGVAKRLGAEVVDTRVRP